MIEKYEFRSITIDGKIYEYEVEVRWTGEVLPWRRRETHVIDVEDVKRAVEQNPDTIVIGTGESGIAKVTEEAKKFIQEKGIKLVVDKTEEAAKTFNVINDRVPQQRDEGEEEGKQNKVIGLFHLTC